jgi:uncharacterized lipoprotein YbaY
MKRTLILLLTSVFLVLGGSGCGHLDLAPETNPGRTVTGTINVHMSLMPPPDAELVVRVVEPADTTTAPTTAGRDMVIGERGSRERPERIVAEQKIQAPASFPVSFKLEFTADDHAMRRGFNIEARISWGGRLRFRNLEAQAITLNTLGEPQIVWMEPVR